MTSQRETTETPSERQISSRVAVGLAAITGFVGIGAGALIGVSANGPATTSTAPTTHTVTATITPEAGRPTTTPAPASATSPAPMTSIRSDGQYKVGDDIAPGTYKSAGGRDGMPCYWFVYDTLAATMDNHTDMGFSMGQIYATVSPADVLFVTSGCQSWTLAE